MSTEDYRDLSPLSKLSLYSSDAPPGFGLLVDAGRMLAIVSELPPPGCQPSFKNCPPPRGTSLVSLLYIVYYEQSWPTANRSISWPNGSTIVSFVFWNIVGLLTIRKEVL